MLDPSRRRSYNVVYIPDKRETSGLRSNPNPMPRVFQGPARFAAMSDAPSLPALADAALKCMREALRGDWQESLVAALSWLLPAARNGSGWAGTSVATDLMEASDALWWQLASPPMCVDDDLLFGLGAAGSLLCFHGDGLHDERLAHAEILYCQLCISLRRRRLCATGNLLARTVSIRRQLAAGSDRSSRLH